jgi:hypothetical protein
VSPTIVAWQNVEPNVISKSFVCGFCSNLVGTTTAYRGQKSGTGDMIRFIYICPYCYKPTYFDEEGFRVPDASPGSSVDHLPVDVGALYEEARKCVAGSCYTAAVLLCRKLLMNIAVSNGAAENLKFIQYVEYLAANNYVPPNGKGWVDHIRNKGNEATHEIQQMSAGDANDLVSFVEMLLKFIFEFPNRIPVSPTTTPHKGN